MRLGKGAMTALAATSLLSLHSVNPRMKETATQKAQKDKQKIKAEREREQEVIEAALAERLEKEQNIATLNKVVLSKATDYEEGRIYEHEIVIKERKIRVIVVKHKERFYCLTGTCTYDGTSRLFEGVVFGDKLLSPDNGSAYNITNGNVEHGPAIDNLPIFQTKVDKDGNLTAFIPDYPPKKIRPLLVGRDFNDLRRVVIIGSDPSTISCAETLRQFEYTVGMV